MQFVFCVNVNKFKMNKCSRILKKMTANPWLKLFIHYYHTSKPVKLMVINICIYYGKYDHYYIILLKLFSSVHIFEIGEKVNTFKIYVNWTPFYTYYYINNYFSPKLTHSHIFGFNCPCVITEGLRHTESQTNREPHCSCYYLD